jgi:serine protease Do
LITAVTKGSAADVAGFRPGDVIVELLGQPVLTADDVLTRVSSATPGERAHAVVRREGRARVIDVTIEALPLALPHRQLHRTGDVSHLGLALGDIGSPNPIVERVAPGSAAETAGLEPGDVIRKINQHTIRTAAEALRELQRIPAGSTVFLLICRDGEEQIVEMDTE